MSLDSDSSLESYVALETLTGPFLESSVSVETFLVSSLESWLVLWTSDLMALEFLWDSVYLTVLQAQMLVLWQALLYTVESSYSFLLKLDKSGNSHTVLFFYNVDNRFHILGSCVPDNTDTAV